MYAYACLNDALGLASTVHTSLGRYMWYLVTCNELSVSLLPIAAEPIVGA
jgi:hypothetical protein